jgi:polyisoprenoid-binding protein YceI
MPSSRAPLRPGAAALLACAVAAPLAVGALAQDATPTPVTVGVLPDDAGLAACEASELGSLPADADPAAVYTLVSAQSLARYRVKEVLAQVGETEAVGETRAIVGTVGFDAAGAPLPCSRWDVDMRTLQSDSARRDNYLYANTLESERFPLATFVLRGVEGLDGALPEGEETTLTLLGDLTVRDQTRPVAWQATVALEGDALTGEAFTEFGMADFGITPPNVPVVLSLEETVRLEVELSATRAEQAG